MRQELCRIADIPPEGTRVVPFFGREVHVYRSGDGFRVVANVCLHFGGPLECKDGKLVCPWHGAAFELGSGACLRGPAPRQSKLLFLSTKTDDGKLYYVWGE